MGRRGLWWGHAKIGVRGRGGNFDLPVPGAAQNIMTSTVTLDIGWSQHEDDMIIPDHNIRGAQLLRPQSDLFVQR